MNFETEIEIKINLKVGMIWIIRLKVMNKLRFFKNIINYVIVQF